MKNISTIFIILLILGLALSPVTVQAANITFAWGANTEADLAGYRLFQRDVNGSYDYSAPVAEIPTGIETCTITITDADWDNEQFRWILRAFDGADNESGDSGECGDRKPSAVSGFG